jgi:hypothetical protein
MNTADSGVLTALVPTQDLWQQLFVVADSSVGRISTPAAGAEGLFLMMARNQTWRQSGCVCACEKGHLQDINWKWVVHHNLACQEPMWLEEKGTSADPADITVVCGCNQQLSLQSLFVPGHDPKKPWAWAARAAYRNMVQVAVHHSRGEDRWSGSNKDALATKIRYLEICAVRDTSRFK